MHHPRPAPGQHLRGWRAATAVAVVAATPGYVAVGHLWLTSAWAPSWGRAPWLPLEVVDQLLPPVLAAVWLVSALVPALAPHPRSPRWAAAAAAVALALGIGGHLLLQLLTHPTLEGGCSKGISDSFCMDLVPDRQNGLGEFARVTAGAVGAAAALAFLLGALLRLARRLGGRRPGQPGTVAPVGAGRAT